jgi:hypothetical protein
MIINLPSFYSGATDQQQPSGYATFSSEWVALDGVEMTFSIYREYEGDLTIASKTRDDPDSDDLVVVPNTVKRTRYRWMLAFYWQVHDEGKQDIIGFVKGFWHPFGGLSNDPVQEDGSHVAD